MKKIFIAFLICLPLLAAGCGGKAVKRIDTGETVDLSGKWNDTDSRLVSEEMIKDVLSDPWVGRFKNSHSGKSPVVIVGTIRNLSHEHISVETFVKDIERNVLKSGEVEFVASKAERDEIRDERKDQAVNASEETVKEHAQEAGADFMLKGTINTIIDRIKGEEVVYYQVNLELVDMKSNKKVWIGEKKIKKVVKRSSFGL